MKHDQNAPFRFFADRRKPLMAPNKVERVQGYLNYDNQNVTPKYKAMQHALETGPVVYPAS
jgi:hypothetical protein